MKPLSLGQIVNLYELGSLKRRDFCPCTSGRKFKRCCYPKVRATQDACTKADERATLENPRKNPVMALVLAYERFILDTPESAEKDVPEIMSDCIRSNVGNDVFNKWEHEIKSRKGTS